MQRSFFIPGAVANSIFDICVSADAGFATIMFKDDGVSEFWVRGKEGLRKPTFREGVLVIEPIRFLFDLINEREPSKSMSTGCAGED